MYNSLQQSKDGTAGLDNNWDAIKDTAYQSVQEPWGGATIDTTTGKPMTGNEDAYALTVREPSQQKISVPIGSSREDFNSAMDKAREQYANQLSYKGGHLGVFHDVDTGNIDIDPTYVTQHLEDVDKLGAYTRAVGGAYHFKSGNGFWPPHVRS